MGVEREPLRDRRVLVVDDDAGIREVMAGYLGSHGLHVDTAADAVSMERVLARNPVDLVLLDVLMPPGEDGLSVCRRLSGRQGPAVILMSAMGSEVDRIVGLELGATDYVAKPCNPRELLARVRAVLRRTCVGPVTTRGVNVRFAGWELDLLARSLRAPDGAFVDLTGGEYALLRAFVENPQRVLNRDELLDLVMGEMTDAFDRAIDVQICRLRKKMNLQTAPELIRTIRHEGYMFTTKVTRRD